MLIEREAVELPLGQIFHRPISPFELGIGSAQRLFCADPIGSDQIDRSEQQIARFLNLLVLWSCSQLVNFFVQLCARAIVVRPVEPMTGGAFL